MMSSLYENSVQKAKHTQVMFKKALIGAGVTLGCLDDGIDKEYECIKKKINNLHVAVRKYDSAVASMQSGVRTLSSAFQDMSKTFLFLSKISGNEGRIKVCDESHADASLSTKDHYLRIYCNALKNNMLSELKGKLKELGKIEEERKRACHSYQVITILVANKEKKYRDKKKSLDTSKKYSSMTLEKEMNEAKFQNLDRKYKETALSLVEQQHSFFSSAMFSYLNASQIFFSNVSQDFRSSADKLDE